MSIKGSSNNKKRNSNRVKALTKKYRSDKTSEEEENELISVIGVKAFHKLEKFTKEEMELMKFKETKRRRLSRSKQRAIARKEEKETLNNERIKNGLKILLSQVKQSTKSQLTKNNQALKREMKRDSPYTINQDDIITETIFRSKVESYNILSSGSF